MDVLQSQVPFTEKELLGFYPRHIPPFDAFTYQLRKKLDEDWLKTEPKWDTRSRVGPGWKPIKVLGSGGQGIAGHWTYDGPARKSDMPITDVVVKQAHLISHRRRRPNGGIYDEARFLRLLATANSPHIVKMFRVLYQDQGQKTAPADWGPVQRIYLEYCALGDMSKFKRRKAILKEEELWSIFHCLAKGALVMHSGSEIQHRTRWNREEIAHFDLKWQNILLTNYMTTSEHRNIPTFKIADFGLAIECPEEQGRYSSNDLDRPWFIPTAGSGKSLKPLDGNYLEKMRYGTPGNVWQIGLIMWSLMRNLDPIPWHDMGLWKCSMTATLRNGGQTLGTNKDIYWEFTDADTPDADKPPFSESLRAAIAECLLIQPHFRPTVEDLVEKTRKGLEAARFAAGSVYAYDPLVEPQTPDPPVNVEYLAPNNPWNIWKPKPLKGKEAPPPPPKTAYDLHYEVERQEYLRRQPPPAPIPTGDRGGIKKQQPPAGVTVLTHLMNTNPRVLRGMRNLKINPRINPNNRGPGPTLDPGRLPPDPQVQAPQPVPVIHGPGWRPPIPEGLFTPSHSQLPLHLTINPAAISLPLSEVDPATVRLPPSVVPLPIRIHPVATRPVFAPVTRPPVAAPAPLIAPYQTIQLICVVVWRHKSLFRPEKRETIILDRVPTTSTILMVKVAIQAKLQQMGITMLPQNMRLFIGIITYVDRRTVDYLSSNIVRVEPFDR